MPPNFLVILTDQQRYDQMGYSSGGHFETANLDRLAASGTIFENAYTFAPICIPSRGSLLTGCAPCRFPTVAPRLEALREGWWTIGHALRGAGYQTMLAGKMHMHPIRAWHGFDQMRMAEHLGLVYGPEQFDDYTRWLVSKGKGDWRATHIFGPEEKQQRDEWRMQQQAMPFYYPRQYHPTDWVAREASEMLAKRKADQPYFMIMSFPHPHSPFDPPAPYSTMYKEEDAILPKDGVEVNDGLPPSVRELMSSTKSFGTVLTEKLDKQLQRRMATYIRALIRQIDDGIGEVLKQVDLSNTVVFFTTDHGDYYGHRGRMLKTPGVPFDDVARVPTFCCGPGITAGRREKNPVQGADFVPTFLDIAGIGSPARDLLDTRSLLPALRDGKPDESRTVYCDSNYDWPMVRRGNLKYFRHRKNGEEMLFDLEADPGETRNLAADAAYAARRDALKEALASLEARPAPDLPTFPMPANWRA